AVCAFNVCGDSARDATRPEAPHAMTTHSAAARTASTLENQPCHIIPQPVDGVVIDAVEVAPDPRLLIDKRESRGVNELNDPRRRGRVVRPGVRQLEPGPGRPVTRAGSDG